MNPLPVRAFDLFIDEQDRRFPRGDQRLPPETDPEEGQPVVEPGALLHDHGLRCQDVEIEFGRRDALQIAGVGEERKYLINRSMNEDSSVEVVGLFDHPPSATHCARARDELCDGADKRRVGIFELCRVVAAGQLGPLLL